MWLGWSRNIFLGKTELQGPQDALKVAGTLKKSVVAQSHESTFCLSLSPYACTADLLLLVQVGENSGRFFSHLPDRVLQPVI